MHAEDRRKLPGNSDQGSVLKYLSTGLRVHYRNAKISFKKVRNLAASPSGQRKVRDDGTSGVFGMS